SGVERMLTTKPYYRSTYVFVSRADSKLAGLTLDDPRLRQVPVGVQIIGNDAMNTPPAHALAQRGVVRNVRGYSVYGDYARPNPPARIVEAVANREIDVGLVWGPLAGYFASRSPTPLRVEPVTPAVDAGVWPMTYDISVGVSRAEPQLRARVDEILSTEKTAIGKLLDEYHVPRVARDGSGTPASIMNYDRGGPYVGGRSDSFTRGR